MKEKGMTLTSLTMEEHQAIKNDMDKQIDMLSDAEIEHLAAKLNEKVDVSFLKEGTEYIILAKIVKKVDRYLYNALPNELYGLIKVATDGLSDDEVEQLTKILSTRANNEVNIKYLPEWVEQEIFEFLIGLIVGAMRRNATIMSI